MKITRILSASVLAGAVLFSGTACSMLDMGKKSESSSSASAKPSESQSNETAVDEQQAVADVVNGYYTYVSTPGNLDEIKQAGEFLKGRGATASEEELNQLVDSLPEGFAYFDTSSPDLTKNAYVQLLVGAGIMSAAKMEMNTPPSAVTVNGDNATVDSTKIEVNVNGKKIDIPSSAASKAIKLKKDDLGVWVMVADDSMSGSATATGKATISGDGAVSGDGTSTMEGSTSTEEDATTTEETVPTEDSTTADETNPDEGTTTEDTSTDQ